MTRPVLLDLFCGAGGAAMGYHQAGFDVVGVDIDDQPNYPFEFVQADALTFPCDGFDAIHASPPCQAYSRTRSIWRHQPPSQPPLIHQTRELLIQSGLPYVIENVVGAPLIQPIQLCGSSFGLDVRRHRLFECSFATIMVPPCAHGQQAPRRFKTHARFDKAQLSPVVHIYGHGGGEGKAIDLWRQAMQVPWMQTRREIREAIPPAYTRHIGEYLTRTLR